MKRFEVHSHTHYSNLRLIDCINKPKDLIDRAVSLGLSGIAITDHEVLSGVVEAKDHEQKVQEANPEFKVAIGNEIYLTDDRQLGQKYYHFILIAKNKIGYRMLRELSSNSWLQSYEDRRMERVPTLKNELREVIEKYGKGNLIATSACLGGELSSLTLSLVLHEQNNENDLIFETKQKIHNFITFCLDLFEDDFYIECAPGLSSEQVLVNERLVSIAKAYNIKMVIGTDAHFLKKEDRLIHKAYLNSKDGEREVDDFYEFSYLQTEEEIKKHLTIDYESMVQNSEEIYNKIENYSIYHKQQIPKVEVKNYPKSNWWEENIIDSQKMSACPTLKSLFLSDDVQERYWINQCWEELKNKGIDWRINFEYVERLEEEASTKKVIGAALETNMFSYPITLQHYINMMWDSGSTIGAGRGSACSGLNHYLLGVTQLDPIKWKYPWFRYMNKERKEIGDIDIDLCPSKRPVIIDKIKKERGNNFIDGVSQLSRDNLGCTLIATFGTEKPRSAIQTACRGYRSKDFPNGIDIDIALYLASLIPQERGIDWTLEEAIYGNSEKDRRPVNLLVEEMKKYPGLLDIALGIQGIIKQRGSHASGVIFFDEDPYEFGAFMRTPSGDVITQFDLHNCEKLGMTKFDFLVTDVQDKIAETINLLQKDGYFDKDLSLREVYDTYLHPDVLPLDDKKMWKALEDGSVINIFQFDSDVGAQAAKKIKPKTIQEMSAANGLMRLMTAEKGEETPMDKYVRFKNDISLWYQEMEQWGLTKEEQKSLEPYFLEYYGVPPSQESLMLMLMDEKICNFSLSEANTARKIIGKKMMNKIPELHQKILDKASSKRLGSYVWKYGAGPQMGYSFSEIHAGAYSFVGAQTLYLGTHYNPIYWNTACLIVNSGSLENNEKEVSTNYEKIAKAIGEIRSKGINVSLVDINKSDFGFKPDPTNNQILFGIKALLNVNDDLVNEIVKNRSYISPLDFLNKVKPKKQSMISLIKGGAFDNMLDRKICMGWYLWTVCDKKKKITLQNMNSLIENNLLPKDLELSTRIYEFNRYLKQICKYNNEYFKLDERAINFLIEIEEDNLIKDDLLLDVKIWDRKVYQKYMNNIRQYINANQTQLLTNLNNIIFKKEWDKYAQGSISDWEMDVLCFYYHEHPLINVNYDKYGLADFTKLPTSPEIERSFKTKAGREINIFKLSKICGTCIAKNKKKGSVSLLTTTGVVNVKFRKEYFAMFDKQISERQPDGTKKVKEKSWFNRGEKIMVQGFRSEDTFIAKKYASSGGHQLYKIAKILDNGDLTLIDQRYQGEYEEEED